MQRRQSVRLVINNESNQPGAAAPLCDTGPRFEAETSISEGIRAKSSRDPPTEVSLNLYRKSTTFAANSPAIRVMPNAVPIMRRMRLGFLGLAAGKYQNRSPIRTKRVAGKGLFARPLSRWSRGRRGRVLIRNGKYPSVPD